MAFRSFKLNSLIFEPFGAIVVVLLFFDSRYSVSNGCQSKGDSIWSTFDCLLAPNLKFEPIDVIHGWIAYKVRIKCFGFILTDF